MEWLVSFGGAYEPVGQGFESLPARHKKQYNFGCTVFYFVRNLQGLEPHSAKPNTIGIRVANDGQSPSSPFQRAKKRASQ